MEGRVHHPASAANRTLQKYLVTLHGIFKRATRVYGLPRNPVAQVERPRLPRRAGIDVLSREEVMALVRASRTMSPTRQI